MGASATSEGSTLLAPLLHRTYRHLFSAQVLALLGTGLATVALGLLAWRISPAHAAGVLGTALAIKMVAYVFVGPLTTAALTRLPTRTVLVGTDLLRMVVAASLPFVTSVWQVYALVFVLQAASATFTPTFQAVIPDVLPDEDEYTAALSLSRLAYDLEAVVSPALAAALLLVVSPNMLFVGTAIGFAGSALLVLGAALPARPGTAPESIGILSRATRGHRLFVALPALRPILLVNLAVAAAGAYVLVETVMIVKQYLGRGDDQVAWLLAANGFGSMVAALALPRLLRHRRERPIILLGSALLAVAMLLVPLALTRDHPDATVAWVALLWWLVGLGWSAAETPVGRLLRRHVPRASLPDAFAAQFSLSHACWLLTYPLMGWLGVVSLDAAALVAAAVAAAATISAATLWPRTEPVDETMSACPTT